MSPRKNGSTCFYKRTTNGLWSLLGRSLERIFELEDNVALANQEVARLTQEISALRNQNDNLTPGQESNTPAEAIPTRSPPETDPDHVNLHHTTRCFNHVRNRHPQITSQILIDIDDVDAEPDSQDNGPDESSEEQSLNSADDDSYALPHTRHGYNGSNIDDYLNALAVQETGWAARSRRHRPIGDDIAHELFERAHLARIARQPTFGPQIHPNNDVRGHHSTDIQYNPLSGSQSHCRTIIVDGLPGSVHLAEVVDALETGEVFSSQLLKTMTLTGAETVRIVYVNESDARRAATSTTQLQFNGHQANITVIGTATYPIDQATVFRINNTSNPATRRIQVHNLDDNIDQQAFLNMLEAAGYRGHHVDGIQHFCHASDGSVYITFDTMHKAIQVHDEFQESGAKVRFVSRTEYEAQGF